MVGMVKLSAESRKSLPENGSEPTGASGGYHFQTGWNILGIPLVCIAFGRNEAGRAIVAKGIIAIGKVSFGLISVGQFSLGILSIGQFGLGLIAFGQVACSVFPGRTGRSRSFSQLYPSAGNGCRQARPVAASSERRRCRIGKRNSARQRRSGWGTDNCDYRVLIPNLT